MQWKVKKGKKVILSRFENWRIWKRVFWIEDYCNSYSWKGSRCCELWRNEAPFWRFNGWLWDVILSCCLWEREMNESQERERERERVFWAWNFSKRENCYREIIRFERIGESMIREMYVEVGRAIVGPSTRFEFLRSLFYFQFILIGDRSFLSEMKRILSLGILSFVSKSDELKVIRIFFILRFCDLSEDTFQ